MRASRASIRAREGARGIEVQSIENEKEEGASVASERERAGRACERGYEREVCKCKWQMMKRKFKMKCRKYESEQGEHAREGTSESYQKEKGKIGYERNAMFKMKKEKHIEGQGRAARANENEQGEHLRKGRRARANDK